MCAAKAKLVLIGWHGADWRSIHPLVDAGLMPNLRALIERGVAGNLRPSGPSVPAMLWASISTGKSADEHGLLSAVECDPLTGGTRPSGSKSRRVKALWNIAMQTGLQSHVVGWSGTHPAENLNGSCITPAFIEPLGRYGAPWPIFPASISSERLAREVAELRVHPGDLAGEDLVPFIPKLHEIDQKSDRRVIAFADTLARTVSTHAISTWLMEHEPWNLMVIGWSGLQRACQQFMRYAPPQMAGIPAADCERYGNIVRGMYCYHDMLLGRIVELAGPDATIAIVSAAGFRSAEERPVSKVLQDRSEAWYRPYGVFCMAGPQTAQDELLHNVTMYDVVPTALHALGIAAGADMPGRVLTEAFHDSAPTERIPSWDREAGDCGMHAPANDDEATAAAMAELRNLGYADPATNETANRLERERQYNASLVHFSRARYAEARTALASLQTTETEPHITLMLAYSCYRSGDLEAASITLRDVPRENSLSANARLLESFIALAQDNPRKAANDVAIAERIGFDRPVLLLVAASMYMRLGQLSRAETTLRMAIELDPSFDKAHALLARLLAMRGEMKDAASAARAGLSVEYGSASLHSALGMALAKNDPDGALQAFETALLFEPQMAEAVTWSAALESRRQKTA